MQSDVLIAGPYGEFVTVATVKQNSRITATDDDAFIGAQLIPAAREYVENLAGVSFVTQTRRVRIEEFPDEILLRRAPVQSVVSVKYVDVNGVKQTVLASTYRVDTDAIPAVIELSVGQTTWPVAADVSGSVEVVYVAGFGDPAIADAAANTLAPSNVTYQNGDLISLRNYGGTLPAGLLAQSYFVVNATATTIQLSATLGGVAIAITDTGTGVHLIGDIPHGYSQAVTMLASFWYEQREAFVTGTVNRAIALSLERLVAMTGQNVGYA